MLEKLSALGDTALLAPASLALLLYLAVIGRWVDARAFALALAVGLGATFVSKLLLKACGGAIDIVNLNSPSGHASFATLFYGCLAVMVAWGRPKATGLLIAVCTALLLGTIGASRPWLGAHSWAEVIVGWLMGLAAVGVFHLVRRRHYPTPLSPAPLAVGLALAMLLVGGRHYTPEQQIGRMARYASSALDICTEGRVTALQPRFDTMLR
jgi:membrane-associated phospholipid phosphatase